MQLLSALERAKVEYVVVGGVALNHAIARATQAIDIFIRPSEDNVDRLKAALQSVWDDPEIDSIRADELQGEYPAILYVPPDQTVAIDLLARLGEAFRFDDIAAENKEFRGINVRVATPQMLYEMKKDTLRLQDKADSAELRERFNLKG